MSVLYCGIYKNDINLKCLGESRDPNYVFKSFVDEHKDKIVRQPLSRKINLSSKCPLSMIFLKFGVSRVLVCIGNDLDKNTKAFINKAISSIKKLDSDVNVMIKDESEYSNSLKYEAYSTFLENMVYQEIKDKESNQPEEYNTLGLKLTIARDAFLIKGSDTESILLSDIEMHNSTSTSKSNKRIKIIFFTTLTLAVLICTWVYISVAICDSYISPFCMKREIH